MSKIYTSKEEKTAEIISDIFERYGFVYTQPGKFEDYNLYIDNKNFLESDNIITFMGIDGKIQALKPDITLSIVKNIQKNSLNSFEKLYYKDEVFRLSKESQEYKVINQIGVELLGKLDSFSNIEFINLAIETLKAIDEDYILDISHNGFISSLLLKLNLKQNTLSKIMDAIYHKSFHDVENILLSEEVCKEYIEKIKQVIFVQGSLSGKLDSIKPLIDNEQMQSAFDELKEISDTVTLLEAGGNVNLDFSAVGDLRYYNGLVVSGYINGVPNKVLAGGRYDKLMEKLGKKNGALGFAVYLSELFKLEKAGEDKFDIIIYYDFGSNVLLKHVKHFTGMGLKVRTENINARGKNFNADKEYTFLNNVLKEVNANA